MKNIKEYATNLRSHNYSVSELNAKHRFYVDLNTHTHIRCYLDKSVICTFIVFFNNFPNNSIKRHMPY